MPVEHRSLSWMFHDLMVEPSIWSRICLFSRVGFKENLSLPERHAGLFPGTKSQMEVSN